MNQYPGLYNLAQGNMGSPYVSPATPFHPQDLIQHLQAYGSPPKMQPFMYMNAGAEALQQQQQQQMFNNNFGNILNNPVCAMLLQLRQIEQQQGGVQQQQQYQQQCQMYMQQRQQYELILDQQRQQLQQQAPLAHPGSPAVPNPTLSPSSAAAGAPSPQRPHGAARRNSAFLGGLFDSKEEKILREYQNLGFFWVWRLAKSGSQFQTFNIPNQKIIRKMQENPVEKHRIMLGKEKTLKGNIVLNLNSMTAVCSYSFLGRNEIIELEIKMQYYDDANLQIMLKK